MRASTNSSTGRFKNQNKPIKAVWRSRLLICLIVFFWLYSCAAIFIFCSSFGFVGHGEPERQFHQDEGLVQVEANYNARAASPLPFHTYEKTIHFFQNEIVGVLLAENDFDLDEFVNRELEPSCAKSGELCSTNSGRKCIWCSAEYPDCIEGAFKFNRKFENQALMKNELYIYQNLQYEYNSREDIRIRMHHYTMFYEIMFSCNFVHRPGERIRGNLTIPWMYDKLEAKKLASDDLIPPSTVKKAAPPASACLVCGRGLYGKVSAENIIKHVEYYKYQGLGTVIMYDIGISYVTNRHLLGKHIESGALTMVDLREFVQFLFGYKSTFSLLRSVAVGQMWLKYDCLLRARNMGYRWALHVDMDEYLFLGVDSLKAQGKRVFNLNEYFKTIKTHIDWLSFGSLKNKKDVELCHVTMKSQKKNFYYDWVSLTDHMNKLHSEHESPNGKEYFIHNFTRRSHLACHDFRFCPGASGLRKIASRTTMNPLDLHIHHVSFREDAPKQKFRQLQSTDQDVSVDKMYIRHYGCLNDVVPRFTNKQRPHKKLSTA